jgi:hypothetical protein
MAIRTDVDWEDYCQRTEMNPSTLVAGCKSMLALKRAIDGGGRVESNAMRLGSGIHALLLEPEQFESRFCVVPDFHTDDGNTTANGLPSQSKATSYYKLKLKEFASNNYGKTFLSRKQYDDALTCIEAIRSRPRMSRLLDKSKKEVTLLGSISGVPFRGRVDILSKKVLCDVKTTPNVEPHAFGRSFVNLRYDFKLAIYRELARQNGFDVEVSVIAQESSGDFDNVYYPVPDIVLDNAWTKVLSVLSKYITAKQTGKWHGVDGGKSKLNLVVPQWSMEDSGEELDWGAESEPQYKDENMGVEF